MTGVRRLVEATMVTGFASPTLPDWLAQRLEAGLGGVCWFGPNVVDADQARTLADALHGTRDGVLVMSDEEGGDVTRLEASVGSSWPGHATLGALDDTRATQDVAAAMGRQLRAAGIDIALAPVVDVNSNPDNPVIGVRSFGATPELVARHGIAFVEGLQSAGVAGCAKHFPGHGSTTADSHIDLPRVDDAGVVLRERDLAPFAAVVRAGVRCVMSAHVVFSALDEQPATLSPRLLGLLRGELGFEGVILSDALDMHAISHGVGRGEGAVRALRAGIDLVCIGNPSFPEPYDAEERLDEVVAAVVAAVDDGRLPIDRLEEAATRVADLTGWLAVQQPQPSARAADDSRLGRDVARRALLVRGDVALREAAPLVVEVSEGYGMAAGCRGRDVGEALVRRDPSTYRIDVDGPEAMREALAVAGAVGREVVVLAGQPRSAHTRRLLDEALAARPDAVMVYTGLPDADAPGDRVICTGGGGRAVGEATADVLTEQLRRGAS
ncbi:MAG: glycoside hydrolase family 3 N-terminal domain-containing protein [Nocardioidaceae bacterium]